MANERVRALVQARLPGNDSPMTLQSVLAEDTVKMLRFFDRRGFTTVLRVVVRGKRIPLPDPPTPAACIAALTELEELA